jgi:hypothetical protein
MTTKAGAPLELVLGEKKFVGTTLLHAEESKVAVRISGGTIVSCYTFAEVQQAGRRRPR